MLEKYFQVSPKDCRHLTLIVSAAQNRIYLPILHMYMNLYLHTYITCVHRRKTICHNRIH